ncbi:MAG: hypothetical protein IT430_03975 [Phycisphaerales bacterium]|nr:hypothetical protein [Phycisphaerales bacterium]
MDRAAKLECLTSFLADDCRCDLVAFDEIEEHDVRTHIVLECWTADHRAFRCSWLADRFDRLSIEIIGNQVQRAYRGAHGLKVPEWADEGTD